MLRQSRNNKWVWCYVNDDFVEHFYDNHERKNFLPYQGLNRGPLKPKASVLPMIYNDPLIGFKELQKGVKHKFYYRLWLVNEILKCP